MVSFIHTGSEIINWLGYSFKTKSTNSKAKQHLYNKNILFESQLQIIRLAQGHWSSTPTH